MRSEKNENQEEIIGRFTNKKIDEKSKKFRFELQKQKQKNGLFIY